MSENTAWGGPAPVPLAEPAGPASSDAADGARRPEDTGGPDRAYGPDEEQLVAERLRALGYIE
jgi:hypothetical protein